MDGALIGANLVALRAMAKVFDTAAAELVAQRTRLEGTVSTLDSWRGSDFTRFGNEWSECARILSSVANTLSDTAQRVGAQADEQERASSDDGSGASAPSVPDGPGLHDALQVATDWLSSTALGNITSDVLNEVPVLKYADDFAKLGAVLTDPAMDDFHKWLGLTGGGVGLAGDTLMDNKATFLYGMAATSVGMALEAASEADFSPETFSLVVNTVAADPSILADELGKATVQVVGDFSQSVASAVIEDPIVKVGVNVATDVVQQLAGNLKWW